MISTRKQREAGQRCALERRSADLTRRLPPGRDRGRHLPAVCPSLSWIQLEQFAATRKPIGGCVWFTGLSGAGKPATARVLTGLLTARGRYVTLLDGRADRHHRLVRRFRTPGLVACGGHRSCELEATPANRSDVARDFSTVSKRPARGLNAAGNRGLGSSGARAPPSCRRGAVCLYSTAIRRNLLA